MQLGIKEWNFVVDRAKNRVHRTFGTVSLIHLRILIHGSESTKANNDIDRFFTILQGKKLLNYFYKRYIYRENVNLITSRKDQTKRILRLINYWFEKNDFFNFFSTNNSFSYHLFKYLLLRNILCFKVFRQKCRQYGLKRIFSLLM